MEREPVAARGVQLAHRRPAAGAVAQAAQRDHVVGGRRALHQRQQRRREALALLARLDVGEHAEEPAPPLV